MIYIHKVLPLLVSPLILIIILVMWASLFRSKRAGLAAICILIVCSLPLVSNKLISFLERDYLLVSPVNAKTADAIVVLSGMVESVWVGAEKIINWSDPDRFFAGLDIFKSGKSNFIIFTRGKLPWTTSQPEGEILREQAIKLGIASEHIFLTREAHNTSDEAIAVKELMKKNNLNSIILVTSSYHMPRAMASFRNLSIETESYATDYIGNKNELNWLSFIPSANALEKTSSGVREVLGRLHVRFITLFNQFL